MQLHAAVILRGISNSLANTFTVPSGSTPNRVCANPCRASPNPFSTSLTVPSPPAATTVSKPSATASHARRRASPGPVVSFKTLCEPISSRCLRKRLAFSPRAAGLKMTQVFTTDRFHVLAWKGAADAEHPQESFVVGPSGYPDLDEQNQCRHVQRCQEIVDGNTPSSGPGLTLAHWPGLPDVKQAECGEHPES